MILTNYQIIYLISNGCRIYAIYMFLKVFFGERITTLKVEIISYLTMYIITSIAFIGGCPPVLIIVTNITLIFLIAHNYKGTKSRKIISSLLIYIIFWAVEMTVVLANKNIELSLYQETQYNSIEGIIIITSITLVIANLFKNFKNLKKSNEGPLLYWCVSVMIPVMSIYIGNIVFMSDKLTKIEMIICTIWIFVINIGIIIIYDILKGLLEHKMNSIYIEEKSKYYENEIILMEKSNEKIRNIKHDIKNHIYTINILAKAAKSKEIEHYTNNLEQILASDIKQITTENLIIDGIFNYKINEAKQMGIEFETNMNIPRNLSLPTVEMTIILGNILDNAIEATAKNENSKRVINAEASYKENTLIIIVKNEYKGIRDENNLQTDKSNKEEHGIGLANIREAAEKIGGTLYLKTEQNIFTVELVLPLKNKP